MCKNNWRIWRHNASTPHSHDVTDKLWWRHNAKSEKTVLSDNGEIRNWQLILAELCFQDIYLLLWMMIFGSLVKRFANDFHLWLHQSWKLLANRLTSDPKIIIHGNSCIILCIMLTSKVVIFIDSMVVNTVYPKKYAHGFCFAVLCCGYTLTDFPISIRLASLALWQSNDCPSASKAILMNMDKYFMWIHYEWLHNHNKAKHNKTVCIFLGIYCTVTSNVCIQARCISKG